MKKLIFFLFALCASSTMVSQNQTIGLDYSFGHSPDGDTFTYDGDTLGNYTLGWYTITGSAEARLSGYGGIKMFTERLPRFSILQNGNVGIGINDPSERLEVLSKIKINNPASRGSSFLKLDRGSEGKDGAAVSFGENGNYVWNSGLLYNGGSPTPDFYISQNSSIRNGSGTIVHIPEFTIKISGNVGIGTTNPDSKLTVKGDIHAEEVKVDLSVPGPDYVFKEDYDLKSLEEVQEYIQAHGHLPNVPSAKEMEENGVQLGLMNMKLLEKIEELTLYVIALEKENSRIESLEEELKIQKKDIEQLKNIIKSISQ